MLKTKFIFIFVMILAADYLDLFVYADLRYLDTTDR